MGLILGLGRSPGEENGYPLQCSCLENPTDRGAWRAAVRGVAQESDTTEHLSTLYTTSLKVLSSSRSPAIVLVV